MNPLTLRQLNRTLLSRQLLLASTASKVLPVIERLVALQAQVASPPYLGLWSRIEGFAPFELMRLRDQDKVVRAALLRSTLHWVSARDYAWIRPIVQPALERAWQSFFGVRKTGIEIAPVCELARCILARGPASMSELSGGLAAKFPQWNREAMEYGARTHVPMVQVPPAGSWKGGTAAKYRMVEVEIDADPTKLVRRYLAAFGPASARDVCSWAGFSGIGKTLESMREELVEYSEEGGRKLFDIPRLSIVDGSTPVPVRFIAEYDNLLLAHADRSRILVEEHRKHVLTGAGRVSATVLIDGFVGGTWKVERGKQTTELRVELFQKPNRKLLREISDQGENLLEFAEPGSPHNQVDVRWIV